MTESGEVFTDLSTLIDGPPHIWVTWDDVELLNAARDLYGDALRFNLVRTEDPEIKVGVTGDSRIMSFGLPWRGEGKRNRLLHQVWNPGRMFSTPKRAAETVGHSHGDLLKFATDVREWCKEQNLPLKASLPGLGSSLLRDKRFWPDDRGRVPRATNERVRRHLPGVYQERRARLLAPYSSAVALDQERAYHRAAQQVPTPNPTNLYARGYFDDPESAPELWAPRNSELYRRVTAQPGLVAVVASSRPRRKGEWRPPVCEGRERGVRYVWTNELPHAERHGLQVEGIVAAWTSEDADPGLPKYGAWAEEQIKSSSEYRKAWLKPTLHSLYGLLAARPRDIFIARSHGNGDPEIYTVRGYAYNVKQTVLPNTTSPTVNVPMLGVLQAEIRARTLALADGYGEAVLHVHADGMHLDAVQLEFVPAGWTAEPITNLRFLDDVSWTSDQRDVLPGRTGDQRHAIRRRRVYRGRGHNPPTYISASDPRAYQGDPRYRVFPWQHEPNRGHLDGQDGDQASDAA